MVTGSAAPYVSLLRTCGAELSREVSSAEKGPLKDPRGWERSASAWTGGEVCVCPAERSQQNCSVFENREQLN